MTSRWPVSRIDLAVGLCLTLAGCSAADRAIETSVISAVGGAAPLVCSFLPGSSDAKICGVTPGAVSDVSKLVVAIIAALPMGARKLSAEDMTPTTILVHNCVVTLPAWQAGEVVRKIGVYK